MGKSKLEFYAKITTSDGREITKRVEEDIPEDLNLENLDAFLSTFDDYERHALKARNGICEEITQAWLEQAKKLLCLQTESYHRALSKHSERFRSADGDEPLRYASRTLVILRTMKGLRLARAGR